MTLEQAYAICRGIAKREAKNFYYAFLALPAARKNAICAVYAFMRKADDLADDESQSNEQRRQQMNSWLAAWRAVGAGGVTSDPVFIATRDAVQRFNIPLSLLDELVLGTTMDLGPREDNTPDTYQTFADLYRYCYLVASVVGLVCIRIFGYTDNIAEKYAEETGVAFQLTNILRDVSEDAERNRVYLPLEDMSAHGVSLDSLLHRPVGQAPTEHERELLAEIGYRAEAYYRSAASLLPLIHKESRPALWVLVEIYHDLLKRIERRNFDVFTSRASVPMLQKLTILSVGMLRVAWVRVTG